MRRFIGKKIKKILIIIVVLAVLVAGIIIAKKYLDGFKRTESSEAKNTIVTEERVITSEILSSSLSDIGELATEEYFFKEAEQFDDVKKIKGIKIPFTQKKYLITYEGSIKAGIDFTDVKVEKDDLKKLIVITLPAAQILSAEVDFDSLEVYEEKSAAFNKLKVEDVNDGLIELVDNAKATAIEKGILERANKGACTLIKDFLKNTYGLTDYTIKVETAK